MSILFEVIDVNCQQADNSFFVPAVTIGYKSVTKYATLYGYNEFGTPSTPPRKYRKLTVSGFSERIGFTAEKTPRQCAGAKYVWSGSGEYDLKGNIISKYQKDLFAQCPKQFWPVEGPISLPGEVQTSTILAQFVGFCWPDWPASCATCDPNDGNWGFIGNQAINSPIIDFTGFYALATDVNTTQTATTINVVHDEICNILTDQPYSWTLTGTSLDNYPITVGSRTYDGRVVVTDPPNLVFPAVGVSDDGVFFHVAQYIVFTDTSNHSMVLSEEYTDTDALNNALVVNGKSSAAQNLPRTTGFTSVFTDVTYTLSFLNLIAGRDYQATVDLWDHQSNTHTTKSYGFTASATTHSITDTIPSPPAGHTVSVSKPTVAFV